MSRIVVFDEYLKIAVLREMWRRPPRCRYRATSILNFNRVLIIYIKKSNKHFVYSNIIYLGNRKCLANLFDYDFFIIKNNDREKSHAIVWRLATDIYKYTDILNKKSRINRKDQTNLFVTKMCATLESPTLGLTGRAITMTLS